MPPRNRGKQPNDDRLFAPKWHNDLRAATNDFCWLLTRGYAPNSVAQLVGNRYRLKTMLLELSRTHGFEWSVELVFDPDKVLAKSQAVVVSSVDPTGC